MTRDVMSRLAAARPPQLDPTADPSRRARDLQRAVAGAPEPGVRRRSPARGPIRWTALGVGLVSAAAAVTVVVSGGGSTPAGPPAAGPPASVDTQTLSGQQVLLVAANNAERQPATDGRYWRVRMLREVGEHQAIHESWYGKDGYYWEGRLVLKGHGGASEPPSMYKEKQRSSRPFSMSDQGFTLNEIRALPTTVKGIEKWAEGIARSVSPNWREKDIDGFATGLLIQLLAQAPALPKTRAAAFRALAGRPGMESVGKAKDGQGRTGYAFREGSVQHLVDPSTAVLLASTSTLPKRHTGTTYLSMGWTNEAPRLISGL
ncbi:CU044_5270 family protein [Actinomadura viridis]|uniref:CU044_5270 family protein n=1 Tax=Actinomadura viridis TaxID=58110 RepID=UPI00367FB99A